MSRRLALVVACAGLPACLSAQTITRESVSGIGPGALEANSASGYGKISLDAAQIVFRTTATNLPDGSSGEAGTRIIRRNRNTGSVFMVSDSGVAASPPLSGQRPMPGINIRPTFRGGSIAWTNDANSIDPFNPCPDLNNLNDIFVNSGVSVRTVFPVPNPCGTPSNGNSDNADIAREGALIAFDTFGTVFSPGDTALRDVYTVNTTGAASFSKRSVSGNALFGLVAGNGDSSNPAIATPSDGVYVAFESLSTNWGTDTNGVSDIYMRFDPSALGFGGLSRISVSSAGVQANGGSFNPDISADGRFVVFASDATNLVPGDSNGVRDVFIRDTQTSTTRRLSVNNSGVQGNAASDNPVISSDGTWVAFESTATNLAANLTTIPGRSHIYLTHVPTGSVFLVTFNQTSAASGGASSFRPSISADGLTVAFESDAVNLVSGINDGNAARDVFVYSRPAIPGNDTCGNAAQVTLDAPLAGSTAGALPTEGLSTLLCGTTNLSPDVYARFTAPCAGSYVFSTANSTYDTNLAIFDSCGGTVLGCNDDFGPNLQSQVTLNLAADQQVLIRVGGFQNRAGDYVLSVTSGSGAPVNDECSTSIALGLGSTLFATCGATPSASPAITLCNFNGAPRDVWYQFTAPSSANYVIETINNNFDTVLAVYSSLICPPPQASQIACNDDFNPPNRRSRVQVPILAGNSVRIRLGGYGGATGSGTIRIFIPGCNLADITDIGDTGAGSDGQLTVDDIIAFVNTFGDGTGCPGIAPCNRADVTDIGDTGDGPDGILTVDDIIAYVNAYGDGC
jgi:Tol biopolymer transport system component